MKVFFYALFVHLSLNLYVFWTGWRILKHRKVLRALFTSFFVIEFLVYLTALIFSRHLTDEMIQIVGFIGTTWMLFLMYMAPLLLIIDLTFLVHKRKSFLPAFVYRYDNRARASAFIAFFCFVVGVMWIGNRKFNHPVIVQKEVAIQKHAGNLKTLRIAMIGDTHFGYLIDKDYVKKYVNLIMAQKPDIILFVGDIVDAGISPLISQNMGEELKQLHAPFGVYSCTGNHEYRYDAEEKIKWINDNGIAMLRDSAVLVDSAFYIIGREDITKPTPRKSISDIIATQQIDKEKPIIVLNHNPKYLDEDVAAGADLALYGHTHHGQFFPGNIYTDLMYEVAYGYKKKGNTHVYVTSGLGLAGPQYRIATQSEIVMITLRFE